MDNMTCDVARDLMPLVLDDMASEDSKKEVERHIENCEACKAYFEGMSMRVSRLEAADADKSFAKFCRDVKRRGRMKRIALVILALLLAGTLGVIGITIFNEYRYTYVAVPHNAVTAQLYLDSGDLVMIDMLINDDHELYYYQEDIVNCGDDGVIVYLTPMEPQIRLGNRGDKHRRRELYNYVWKNGQLYRREEVFVGEDDSVMKDLKVLSLRWGVAEDNAELYNAGDILPDGPK